MPMPDLFVLYCSVTLRIFFTPAWTHQPPGWASPPRFCPCIAVPLPCKSKAWSLITVLEFICHDEGAQGAVNFL